MSRIGLSGTLAARMAAPYLAVLVFWVGFHSAWLTLLAYHLQILFWNPGKPRLAWNLPWPRQAWLLAPCALAGPVVWLLLPHITRVDLAEWLAGYGVTTPLGMLVLAVYYGALHPVLEQRHWDPLRRATPWAHVAFAAYHLLVLHALLPWPWLAVCLVVLTAASILWSRLTERTGTLAPATFFHMAADLGLGAAAYLWVSGARP